MAITTAAAIAMGVGMAASAAGTAVAASLTPDAPDYAKASREAQLADIETLPLRKLIESAAKLGTKVTYTDPRTGKQKTADFTGFGDVDQAKATFDWTAESADKMAKLTLDLQNKYGEDFIKAQVEQLQKTDPTGFALREQLGKMVSEDLGQGYGLPKGLEEQVVQSERAAQAARGNILGKSSGAAEALKTGDAAFRMYQQRLANASAFLSGTTPVAQFGQLSQGQGGTVNVQPLALQQGAGVNPNAGAQGAQFALQNYQNQLDSNPWAAFAGNLAGMGLQTAGTAGSLSLYQSILGKK